MATIEVDENTMKALELAAHIAGTTPGGVVKRLVEAASTPKPSNGSARVDVVADYEGHRTRGKYDSTTHRVDITSGPLAGQSFKSPTGAARAIVHHYKPSVSSNRNGWSFWLLDDGSGEPLQSIRG